MTKWLTYRGGEGWVAEDSPMDETDFVDASSTTFVCLTFGRGRGSKGVSMVAVGAARMKARPSRFEHLKVAWTCGRRGVSQASADAYQEPTYARRRHDVAFAYFVGHTVLLHPGEAAWVEVVAEHKTELLRRRHREGTDAAHDVRDQLPGLEELAKTLVLVREPGVPVDGTEVKGELAA